MFPDYFSHVDTKLQFPAHATLAALAFNVIYGLLYLVSTTAFNSIITSAVLYINITIAAPQILLVFRGRDKMLPERPFKLGLIGWLCNVFALCWIPVLIVLVCMPPALPITVESMNYTSPILVGIVVIIVGGYFVFGKHFEGPNIDWDMLNAGNRLEHEMKTSSG
jgi:choline transport protein